MYRNNAKNRKQIYPLFAVLISMITLFFGLITARFPHMYWFYLGIILLYMFLGFFRAVVSSFKIAVILTAVFAGLTYLISRDINRTIAAVYRSLAISCAAVPGMLTNNTLIIRNMQQLKINKMLVLGMMITINFFPLFKKEVQQIHCAMKTRGATSFFNPKVLYRAFLVPLVVRIVNISDTLSVSVETRGFTIDKKNTTVYNPIKIKKKDIVMCLGFVGIVVVSVILSQLNITVFPSI